MTRENLKDLYPLTPMQEGMLFHSLYDDSPSTFLEQVSCSINGSFDIYLFEQSWNELLNRHDILRTVLITQKVKRPLQMVLKQCKINIDYQDIQNLSQEQQKNFLDNYKSQDRQRSFKLERDILMRVAVFKVHQHKHELIWTYHHILMDGWSSNLLLSQLIEIYETLVNGQIPALSTAPRYSSFIQWLQQQDNEAAKNYWRQYLQGYEYPVKMPTSQFSEKGYESSTSALELDEITTIKLDQLARKFQVTLSTIVQSIWAILLSKYHDVDDVIFGSTVSGRPAQIKGIEKMVGLFINTIPVRVKVKPCLTFVQLIEQVQQDAIACKDYTYYSLADIQAQSLHKSELIEHIIVFQNYPAHERVQNVLENVNQFSIENINIVEQSNYNFSIVVTPGEQLKFRFLYNSKVFSTKYIQRLESHLRNAIQAIVENPEIKLADIKIISHDEIKMLLSNFNATESAWNQQETIIDLIEKQANKTPNAIAACYGRQNLTYHQLSTSSNNFAVHLCERFQVQQGDVIAILLEPSEHFITIILAVMKAGCGFLALDYKAPAERNQIIIKESNTKLVISEDKFKKELEHFAGDVLVIQHQQDFNLLSTNALKSFKNLHSPLPHDLAYIMFTSGSTGKPKGIAVNHNSLYHYISWCSKFYIKGRDIGNMPLFTSPAFDLTITSIFCPLIHGKTVVVIAREHIDETLKQIIDLDNQIDIIKLTPSHISSLKHIEFKKNNIKLTIVGGEDLKREQVETLLNLNPNIEVYNEYGPAEATVGCVAGQVAELNRITIGKPIDNTKIYILNKDLQPVPIGCIGEIYIAGSCLSDGYWKNPTLTKEKFIEHPLEPKSKLYQSGDLGKWLENGELIYLGRKDDQVKIRGHRIELNEIENLLKQHPGVKDAVVVYENQGNEHLQAYIIPNNHEQINIRSFLIKQLPEYMIPQKFYFTERFSLTNNGKLNRQALIQEARIMPEQNSTPLLPDDSKEKVLAEIWQDLLGIEIKSIDDDFFALGGHSLKALMLLSRIRKNFGIEINLKSVFEHSTIRALSKYISEITHTNNSDYSGKNQMILLNSGHDKYIFALPTILGYGIAFKALAQHLKFYSVYGLDFIEDNNPIARYTELFVQTRPQDSYILLGYCGGGNLAFEIAKELEKGGHFISDIIMLDSSPWKYKRNESEAVIKERVDNEIAYYSTFMQQEPDLKVLLADTNFKIQLRNKMASYMCYLNNQVNDGLISANIHLIRSQETQLVSNGVNPWINLTKGSVSTYDGSGNHGDMFVNEHLQYNSCLINKILEPIYQKQKITS